MSIIELIIFDCDGVLVDSEPIVNQVFLEELNKVGIPISLDELFKNYVGRSLDQCLQLIHLRYGILLGNDFLKQYNALRDLALESRIKAIDGVDRLISQLRLPHCVASNSDASKVKRMLELTGLLHYFEDKIFSAADMGKPKPAPDIYLKAASHFGVKPEACLVIEDTVTGVSAGVAAGMTVFGYAAITSKSQLLNAGAEKVFDSMSDIQTTVNIYQMKKG
jgi:HAD superfamily hydrolase (TIGR01509 family)